METSKDKDGFRYLPWTTGLQQVLFAQTPNSGLTVGVVCESAPSSLALLAAGVAGMAARRARRQERLQFVQEHKAEK
jgi:hypothetical protein